jgi:hypothetical protein
MRVSENRLEAHLADSVSRQPRCQTHPAGLVLVMPQTPEKSALYETVTDVNS